jgi:hypothetical protein
VRIGHALDDGAAVLLEGLGDLGGIRAGGETWDRHVASYAGRAAVVKTAPARRFGERIGMRAPPADWLRCGSSARAAKETHGETPLSRGREAGLLARIVQAAYRSKVGREVNPPKILARVSRVLLWTFSSNALLATGRWAIGRELAQLVRVRVAALNGCPF